jgi:hypothetical protein
LTLILFHLMTWRSGRLFYLDFLEGSLNLDTYGRIINKQLKKGASYYRQKVKREWFFWRPVVYGVLSFTEAAEGDPELLNEANAALDNKFLTEKTASKKKK